MRLTLELIDSATSDERLRRALYDLSAQEVASQALAIGLKNFPSGIDTTQANNLIEAVAGYPGVTGSRTRAEGQTLGARAFEIFERLWEVSGRQITRPSVSDP